jgi:hypothetical protein
MAKASDKKVETKEPPPNPVSVELSKYHNDDKTKYDILYKGKELTGHYGIEKYPFQQPDEKVWRLEPRHSGGNFKFPQFLKYMRFKSPQEAAEFFVPIYRAVEETTKATPLPDNIMDYFNREAREFKEEQQALSGQFLRLQMRRQSLIRLAKQYGIEEATSWSSDADLDEKVNRLLTISLEGKDVPFFSEASLYKLLGKEDARTIRAVLRNVIALVAPEQAELF